MKSNNEEYLDSLLDSAQKSNNNSAQSALSRISARNSSAPGSGGAGDIGALVNNSGGSNNDLNEIGSLLNRLDRDELVDDRMSGLLSDIEKPIDPRVRRLTIGDQNVDARDAEEIALDEAIADAERKEAELLAGMLNKSSADGRESAEAEPAPEAPPLVDTSGGDDTLLEVAPEVSLPEENQVVFDKEPDSDANETPEEILTDLLDDVGSEDLTVPREDTAKDSLSDVLDNMSREDEEEDGLKPSGSSSDIDDLSLDDFSLEDLEKAMDESIAASDEPESPPAPEADDKGTDSPGDDTNLADLDLGGFTLDGMDGLGISDGEVPPAEGSDAPPPSDDGSVEEPAPEAPSEGESEGGSSAPDLDALTEDDFNLDELEASLDNLLDSEQSDSSSTEGEVAETVSAPEGTDASSDTSGDEAMSMQELDALMDSLANDEIENAESTKAKDEQTGHADKQEDSSSDDFMGALTEEGFDEPAQEPSLDELASIPEKGSRKSGSSEGDDDEEDGKGGKKKKKPGFFARLFAALVKEDEEPEGEGLASLTDENQKVLDELGEEGGKKKKEKQKKDKKPKEKKPKKEKPPKEKKPPKPKKEKKPKPPKDPGEPEKAISPKKIAVSGIFAASLGILILIPSLILPDRIASERASTAFEHKEYVTSYKMLYGKDMTEEESTIYEQSRVIAWAERYFEGYQNYVAMNMKEEALDMLLMAMRNRDDLLNEAAKYSVENDVIEVYDSIESVLLESYGLSEADIVEINSIKKDRDYTIRLMEIVGTL